MPEGKVKYRAGLRLLCDYCIPLINGPESVHHSCTLHQFSVEQGSNQKAVAFKFKNCSPA